MYFPFLGSHFTIWFPGSKQAVVISPTDTFSWYACAEDRVLSFSAWFPPHLPFLQKPEVHRLLGGSGFWMNYINKVAEYLQF